MRLKIKRDEKGRLTTEGIAIELSKRTLTIKLPAKIDPVVREVGNYNQFCRLAIHHALIKKGLLDDETIAELKKADMIDETL